MFMYKATETARELADEAGTTGTTLEHTPVQASKLRKGDILMIKKRPCKIVNLAWSHPGKHGHAKIRITAIDVFRGRKYDDVTQSNANVWVPQIVRTDAQVLSIDDDDFMSLLLDNGTTRQDLKLDSNSEVGIKARALYEADETVLITVMCIDGEEAVVNSKAAVFD
eukprot:m.487034 g.487034  ORF g.487034 m.487034 type:complete len:167 (+) comp24752_c0_seq1:158-658(+)